MPDKRESDQRAVKAADSEWVNCPVCGESDMQKVREGEGFLIFCTNTRCASNGGDNISALSVERELQSAHRLWEKEHDELVILRRKLRRLEGETGQAAPPTEPCESAKRIARIIHDEMKALLAKHGLKHKGDDKTEEFVAEMVQLAINDSGPTRMLKELWEPNLCGHQKMFLYATTGATILNCALCRIAELEEAAPLTEQEEQNAAREFVKKNLPALMTDSSDRPELFFKGWMARAVTPAETCPTHDELLSRAREFWRNSIDLAIGPKTMADFALNEIKKLGYSPAPASVTPGETCPRLAMTFGEWCDKNVLQPTMGNVELYASAMISMAWHSPALAPQKEKL